MAQPIVTGGTYKFQVDPFSKDGTTWNLASATVTLYLVKPDGTVLTKSATVTSAAGGVASYTTLTTDLDTAGTWKKRWRVVDGSVTLYSDWVLFAVN